MALQNSKLYTICFLDALSVGFLAPILSTHIFSLGGTHTVLGTLATLHAAFQFISGPIIRSWTDTLGKKSVLLITLFINYLTYVPLGLTTSYVIVMLLRLTCALTNQTQTLCKAHAAELNAQVNHDSVYSLMSALAVAGFVVGPIIGGLVYEYEDGFYYLTLLAGAALALCLLICATLPYSEATENEDTTSLLEKINESCTNSLSNLKRVSLNEQWDVVLSKYLYSTSTIVFFIKFSLLLKFHYKASSTVVGYTYGYQSILTFLSHFIIAFIKPKPAKDNKNLISSLFIATVGFFGLCYAPTYDIYLVSFIPMILAHTLLNSSWKELFVLRSTEKNNIESVEDTVTKIASVVTPIIFGIFCDLYGHYALKAFVILPLIFNILLAIVISPKTAAPLERSEKED